MRNIFLAFIFASFFTSKAFAVCISGNCENGYGTWLFGNGSEYIGDFINGNFHGQGSYTSGLSFARGEKYIGEWKNNVKDGLGIEYYVNGDVYDGNWKKGRKHGHGILNKADGYQYTGNFSNGKRHGFGAAINPSGLKYVAQWNEDELIKESLIYDVPSTDNGTSVSDWLGIAQDGFNMSSGSSASQTCFKTGEVKQAFNKICNYKCGLTTYTTNLGTGVGLCPSTIQR